MKKYIIISGDSLHSIWSHLMDQEDWTIDGQHPLYIDQLDKSVPDPEEEGEEIIYDIIICCNESFTIQEFEDWFFQLSIEDREECILQDM